MAAAGEARDREERYREPELSVVEHCKTAPTGGKKNGWMGQSWTKGMRAASEPAEVPEVAQTRDSKGRAEAETRDSSWRQGRLLGFGTRRSRPSSVRDRTAITAFSREYVGDPMRLASAGKKDGWIYSFPSA